MQKQLAFLVLSVLMLSQGCMSLWSYVGFYANQDYIAENLCVQKEVIENDCQGHCVLDSHLQKSQEQEQKDVHLQYKEIQLFVQNFEFKVLLSPKEELTISTIFPEMNAFIQKGHLESVFHPPIA